VVKKNETLELIKEENLDINYELAKSRVEFARKALKAGRYDLAIDSYKEALKYIPNDVKALKGLAEVYRQLPRYTQVNLYTLYDRVQILKELGSYDLSFLEEWIIAIDEYYRILINKGHSVPIEEKVFSSVTIEKQYLLIAIKEYNIIVNKISIHLTTQKRYCATQILHCINKLLSLLDFGLQNLQREIRDNEYYVRLKSYYDDYTFLRTYLSLDLDKLDLIKLQERLMYIEERFVYIVEHKAKETYEEEELEKLLLLKSLYKFLIDNFSNNSEKTKKWSKNLWILTSEIEKEENKLKLEEKYWETYFDGFPFTD